MSFSTNALGVDMVAGSFPMLEALGAGPGPRGLTPTPEFKDTVPTVEAV